MNEPRVNPSVWSPPLGNSSLCDQLPGVYYQMNAGALFFIACSQGSWSLLGFRPAELMTENNFEKLIHPEDRDLVHARKNSIRSFTTLEYRVATRQGNFKWIRDEFIFTRQANGELLIEGHLTGIEESRMKWQLLNQLNAYRDAIDVNIISSITDVAGTIVYANRNFCSISQYDETELLGKNHNVICSGHHPRKFFAHLWQTISSGQSWHGEILNKAKDGSLYWVDTVIIPVFDDQTTISHYLSLRTLITGRKAAEKQKDEYIQMLEDIAFIIAHRLRGPLCSITGLVYLMVHPSANPKTDIIAMGYLRNSVNELDIITQELSRLLYSREIDLEKMDYRDNIKQAAKARGK